MRRGGSSREYTRMECSKIGVLSNIPRKTMNIEDSLKRGYLMELEKKEPVYRNISVIGGMVRKMESVF